MSNFQFKKKSKSVRRNYGKEFEQSFKESLRHTDRFFYERRKDGTASWQSNRCPRCKTVIPSKTRFQAPNICDSSIFDNKAGLMYYFELKSHAGKSIPFKAIRTNQIKEISKASRGDRTFGYMVFNMRDVESTYMVPIELVVEYIALSSRKSFPISWMEENGVRLGQRLKKVKYDYEIDYFLERSAQNNS